VNPASAATPLGVERSEPAEQVEHVLRGRLVRGLVPDRRVEPGGRRVLDLAVVGAQSVGQLRATRPVADVIGERPARDRVGGDRAQHLEDRVRVERPRGERRLEDRRGGGELGVDVRRLDQRRLRERRDPAASLGPTVATGPTWRAGPWWRAVPGEGLGARRAAATGRDLGVARQVVQATAAAAPDRQPNASPGRPRAPI
jgi:hypothetical protein